LALPLFMHQRHEKIEFYKNGSIPVYGSISYWFKAKNGQPEFGFFPEGIGRTYCSAVLSNQDEYHDGISHLTLSALSSDGKKQTEANQQILRLDKLVLNMGEEVCEKFGKEVIK